MPEVLLQPQIETLLQPLSFTVNPDLCLACMQESYEIRSQYQCSSWPYDLFWPKGQDLTWLVNAPLFTSACDRVKNLLVRVRMLS